MISLQQHLNSQQMSFKVEKKEHTFIIQALEQESAHQEAAQWCIEHEQATIHKLTNILDKLKLINAKNLDIDFLENVDLVTLFHE